MKVAEYVGGILTRIIINKKENKDSGQESIDPKPEADRELSLRWYFAEHYLLCTDERVGRSFP